MIAYKKKPFYLEDTDIAWVESTYASMTLEEKIGHLFCLVGYDCNRDYLRQVIETWKVGSFMCRPMESKELRETIGFLQKNAKLPMLISGNIESGGNGIVEGGTKMGSPMEIAATGDIYYARLLGTICGEEGTACGANWTYAPIVDIDMNFRNPITNTRTFGADPKTVADFSEAYIRAVQACGMAATAKHFPGDGVDERDQHLVTTVNSLSCSKWLQTYGMVYRRCIQAGVKTIMAGHIMQPAWSKKLNPQLQDDEILPASLSKELITGLLREKLGFNGVVVTDATSMAGMAAALPRNQLIPTAIAAGCDMITFTKNTPEDFLYMRQGIESGQITQDRLKDAVCRVLALKASLGLHKRSREELIPSAEAMQAVVSNSVFQGYARACAGQAITLVKEETGVLPISPEKYPRVLLYDISGGENAMGYGAQLGAMDTFEALLQQAGFQTERYNPSMCMEGLMGSFEEFQSKYDLLLYLASMATKSNQTTVRIEWAQPMGANVPVYVHTIPTIFISLENPYHLLDVPQVRTYINTYSSDTTVVEVLVEKLLGKSPFMGQSPSDPFCGKWDAKRGMHA